MTGWQEVNEKWYYLYEDCSVAIYIVVNGYAVDENGTLAK